MSQKILLSLISVLTFYQVHSQIKSGDLIYKANARMDVFQKDIDNAPEIPAAHKHWFSQVKKGLPYLKLKLVFNQNEASYKTLDGMGSDNDINPNFAAKFAGSDGVFYTNLEENSTLHQLEYVENQWIVKREISNLNWQISNETKKIKGYICQKATATYDITHMPKGDLSVWFAKKLPFQYGPIGLAGLPGLILEVDYGYFHYHIDKMNFSKKPKMIKKPSKGELLPLEEYQKKSAKIDKKIRASYKN